MRDWTCLPCSGSITCAPCSSHNPWTIREIQKVLFKAPCLLTEQATKLENFQVFHSPYLFLNFYQSTSAHDSFLFFFFFWLFSSVAQSCPTLCDPRDCSAPGFPVYRQLPEFIQTRVHWDGDAIQPSHPVIPFSSCLQSFPASGSFQMSQFFTSGGQRIGVSASASVLPMNI